MNDQLSRISVYPQISFGKPCMKYPHRRTLGVVLCPSKAAQTALGMLFIPNCIARSPLCASVKNILDGLLTLPLMELRAAPDISHFVGQVLQHLNT